MPTKNEKKSIEQLKVLFVAAEVAPFTKAGGVADVVSSLAAALADRGYDVRVATPKHGTIKADQFHLQPYKENITARTDRGDVPFSVYRDRGASNVPIYFIDHKEYFSSRRAIYGYWDDAQRFQFFDIAVLSLLENMSWKPDVIHCHDWHAGLIPYYLKHEFKKLSPLSVATVYTIHNLQYQGIINEKFVKEEEKDDGHSALPPFDSARTYAINFAKRGILHADVINAVSEQYARDILTPKFGEGLDKLLRENRTKLFGILNGIDYREFNPAADRNIAAHYDVQSIDKKVQNKTALQRDFGLEQNPSIPLIGMATRLVGHKGLDMLIRILPSLLKLNFQLVVVGSGEERFQNFFWELAQTYPKRIAAHLIFDTVIASRIYAGSDMFLMPSEFEPAGLTQLISMRYGSIPIVHATGGLSDTVEGFDASRGAGTGFVFTEYDDPDLLITFVRALENYKHRGVWKDLMHRAMEKDFSWKRSAQKYVVLYQRALRKVASKKVDTGIREEELMPTTPGKSSIVSTLGAKTPLTDDGLMNVRPLSRP